METTEATWPRQALGLDVGVEVDDARDWLARLSATSMALARSQAGWVARTDDLALACALAARTAEDSDHADLLYKRQYGLRAFPHEMVRDSRVVPAWLRDLEDAPDLGSYLTALYRVVKPRLLAELRRYRARTAPNADGPTLRQLGLIEPELEDQLAWGEAAIERHVGLPDPAALARAGAWAAAFEQAVGAGGGFFGVTLTSDRALPRRPAPASGPALRQLAWVVASVDELPWEARLGLARHLGDLGRYTARHATDPQSPSSAPLLDALDPAAQLRRAAELLEASAEAVTDERDRFEAAAALTVAKQAREWAARLERPTGSNGRPAARG